MSISVIIVGELGICSGSSEAQSYDHAGIPSYRSAAVVQAVCRASPTSHAIVLRDPHHPFHREAARERLRMGVQTMQKMQLREVERLGGGALHVPQTDGKVVRFEFAAPKDQTASIPNWRIPGISAMSRATSDCC